MPMRKVEKKYSQKNTSRDNSGTRKDAKDKPRIQKTSEFAASMRFRTSNLGKTICLSKKIAEKRNAVGKLSVNINR